MGYLVLNPESNKFTIDDPVNKTIILFVFFNTMLFAVYSPANALVSFGKILGKNQGCYIAAFVDYYPPSRNYLFDDISNYQLSLGRTISSVVTYQDWGFLDSNFPLYMCIEAKKKEIVPMISWEPWNFYYSIQAYSLDNIIAGRYDDYIREWALMAKSYGGPIFLRFAHEMNGNWYPWGGASFQKYINAWRHVHDIFTLVEADNVTWVWNVNTDPAIYDPYYPGDEYVDWIGIDGYNWGTKNWVFWTSHWRSFNEAFHNCYNNLKSSHPNKPIMIAEMGCAEYGGSKAAWVSDAFSKIKNTYSLIKSYGWFNTSKINEPDWRIESSSSSLNAIKLAMTDSHYKSKIIFPSVTIIAPNGGEVLKIGTQYLIKWYADDAGSGVSVKDISLYYSIDGGVTYPYSIIEKIPNTGSFIWNVPIAISNYSRVKIIATNLDENSLISKSDADFKIINNFSLADVSNVLIARAGDNVGSAVSITWNINPQSNVDIWTCFQQFTTNSSLWIKEKSNYSANSWTDPNQVGQGTQKYYKVMPVGVAITNADLTSEVVGKFDKVLPGGPSSSMVSTPLIPSSVDINNVIGGQLTGGSPADGDKIYNWNGSSWSQAFLKTNGLWNGPLASFESDKGYFININSRHSSKTVSFVGKVSFSNRTISLGLEYNLIGSSYPVSNAISNSSLSNILTGGSVSSADKVYYWDGNEWKQCFLRSDNTFVGTLNKFEPGCAYYIKNQNLVNTLKPDVWNYEKPY